jgi:4-hydroxybenzoate polyprenyltransferase
MNKFVALVKATHWPQALTMIVLTTAASALLGQSGTQLFSVFFATACGQASVGWVNDYVDTKIDRELNRRNKPSVRYSLEPVSLKVPILTALIGLVPFSFLAAGWLGGLAQILAVASAQVYNLYLSRTVMSWLPYAISFALFPVFVAQSKSSSLWPSGQIILMSALVGVIAHIFNALPDLAIDKKAELGGLVVSLGEKRTLFVLVALMLTLLILLIKTLQP